MITLLDSENADRDLTSLVTCLTHTPNPERPLLCKAVVKLGDGSKDLDQSLDDTFILDITVGSSMIRKEIDCYVTVSDRQTLESDPFVVAASDEVVVKVKSPNPADSDVNVTAYLYAIDEPPMGTIGIVDDATATATDFDGDGSLIPADDHYNNCWLCFLDGPNAGISRLIRDYTGTSRNLAFTGDVFPAAPNNGDRFIIFGNAPASV